MPRKPSQPTPKASLQVKGYPPDVQAMQRRLLSDSDLRRVLAALSSLPFDPQLAPPETTRIVAEAVKWGMMIERADGQEDVLAALDGLVAALLRALGRQAIDRPLGE